MTALSLEPWNGFTQALILGNQPDEDDEGYEAKPASAAPSAAGLESGDTWLREPAGEDRDLEAGRNVSNNNDKNSFKYNVNNNNNRCESASESEDGLSTPVQGLDDSFEELPASPDIRELDGHCRYDDSGICRFENSVTPIRSSDHSWIPSAQSLLVPDYAPNPIKNSSAIKAMQSFPANVVLSPVSRMLTSQAEVDV